VSAAWARGQHSTSWSCPPRRFSCRSASGFEPLREVAGLTQEQVAERPGFTGKYVSEIERGLRDVPLSTLERVATRALDTKVEALFGARASEVWESPALPRSVEVLARRVAALPDLKRRAVLRILRELLGVVGG
jgi:transcriptional regulator with XRE-family HTH domain